MAVKKSNKSNKFNIKYLVLIIIIVLLLIINLTLYLKKVAKPQADSDEANRTYYSATNTTNKSNNAKTAIRTDDELSRYLSALNEGGRMEYYCGKFIRSIQDKEYEKAYSLLYGEFKENYFPTIGDFIKYVEGFYPQAFGLEYDDIERFGDLYVIRLKILDYSAQNGEEPKIQRVVVRENGYNDYKISFQVEQEENN